MSSIEFEWSNDIAVDFENVSFDINVGDLFEKLDAISFNTTQKGIDNLCHHLNEKIISTAKAVGAYREIKKSKSKNSVQVKSPPWLKILLKDLELKLCHIKSQEDRSRNSLRLRRNIIIINWRIKFAHFVHLAVRIIGSYWINLQKVEYLTIKYVYRHSWNILRNWTVL